jgi:hypothetical protein
MVATEHFQQALRQKSLEVSKSDCFGHRISFNYGRKIVD